MANRPTIFQDKIQPILPQNFLNQRKSSWDDSSSSNPSSQKKRPLAVRGKFIYDPENGGGRQRRDKRIPIQKRLNNEDLDRIEKSYGNFNDRLQMTPDDTPSPHKKL